MVNIIYRSHLKNGNHPDREKCIYFLIYYNVALLFVAPQTMGQGVGRSDLERDGGSPSVFGKITLPLGRIFVQSPKESELLIS